MLLFLVDVVVVLQNKSFGVEVSHPPEMNHHQCSTFKQRNFRKWWQAQLLQGGLGGVNLPPEWCRETWRTLGIFGS